MGFYPALTLSLSCLLIAMILGVLVWAGKRALERRRQRREEALKRKILELTGQDFATGLTSVKDLERKYGKRG